MPARVTIVGGGFTGAATAIQLVRAAASPVEVTIVEPRTEVGPGFAYSTSDPDHRLNGPLESHLLDPAAPEELRRWCERKGILDRDPAAPAANGAVFLRRGDFGAYLADAVRAHAVRADGSSIRHHRSRAVGLVTSAAGMDVRCLDGATVGTDLVVIATGSGVPREDALDPRRLAAIPRTARVLVAGSGLTALDAISTLLRQRHTGPIVSISRHGRRPRAHRAKASDALVTTVLARIEGDIPGFLAEALARPSALALSRATRAHIRTAVAAGAEWHGPFDDVRNVLGQVWPMLPIEEKRRALRHLRPWYDVHRFRAPPQNEHIVRAAEARGQVAFRRGHLADVVAEDFDVAISCTGLDPACGALDDPFLSGLLRDGTIQLDATGIGFAVTAHCQPIGSDGVPRPRLRIFGPPTAGTFGDPLGVIFIASQIRRMLPGLLEEIG